jgi:cell wall-associated NlpC family hydrolase
VLTHALRSTMPATGPSVVSDDRPSVVRRTPLSRLFALLIVIAALASLGACTTAGNGTKGAQIVSFARSHIGARYVYGAAGPNTFDCSGLVQYVHRQAGLNVPRTTGAQQAAARPVAKSAAQPGDVIFIGGYHVGIYVGGGQMIDAPKTGDVVKQRPIWTSAYSVGRFY